MNWDAVGAIGQVLGSVAVFVTLAYLALQVRHARRETQRALSQGRSEAHRDLLAQQLTESVFDACRKADVALGASHTPFVAQLEQRGLTLDEAHRVSSMNIGWWTYFLQMIPYVDELTPIELTAFENRVRAAYGRPGASHLFYETYLKATAHPDAVRYLENLLAQSS
jgi:hypothetical protein